jgi:hypothetical protein
MRAMSVGKHLSLAANAIALEDPRSNRPRFLCGIFQLHVKQTQWDC